MPRAEPEKLGDILARGGSSRPGRRRQRLDLIRCHWEAIAGPDVSDHCEPTRLARGSLTVSADGPSWATEFSLRTAEVARRLDGLLGEGVVTKVKVRSRPPESPPEQSSERDSRPSGAPAGTTGPSEEVSAAVGAVGDEKVRKALERMIKAGGPPEAG